MKELMTIVTIALLTTGCASTESTFSQYNAQALKIKPSKEADYKAKHAELAQSMGEIQQSLESPYGTIYAFSQGGYDSYPYVRNPFLRTAEELFKNSCKGEVSSLKRFEKDAHEGRLNPLHYATEEEIELISKHAVRKSSKWGPYYLSLSYEAMLNRDQEENRDSISNFYTPFVESVDFAAKGITLFNPLIPGTSQLGTKACYSDGKMVGAQIFFSHYKVKNAYSDKSAIAGTHALTSLYIPSKTIDTFIKNAFEMRLENVPRQIRLEEARAARVAARVAARKEEKAVRERAIAKRDAAEKQKWNNRFNNELNIGDSVCTPDNKMGFIEQVNGNNIKVWFRGRLVLEGQNYFFGYSRKGLNSSFSYKNLNSLAWVKRGDVASCEFKIDT